MSHMGMDTINNFIGYVHAIAHGVGGLYGVTHGMANAIILPVVLEGFGRRIHRKLAILADLVGIEGNNDAQKAEAFIKSIRDWNQKLGIENIVKIKKKDIPELVDRALKEGNPTYPVTVIWEKQEFERIIKKLV